MTREGTVSKSALAAELGKAPRTVQRWIRSGVYGVKLPFEYVGAQIVISWDDFRDWQDRIKRKRTGVKPAPRHKTCKAAHEALKANGYL